MRELREVDIPSLLAPVREGIERLERENTELRALIRKAGTQLDDALDEVYALRSQLRERDQMIEELRTLRGQR